MVRRFNFLWEELKISEGIKKTSYLVEVIYITIGYMYKMAELKINERTIAAPHNYKSAV